MSLFGHLTFVLIYLDDLVFSKTEEQHLQDLNVDFKQLLDNHIREVAQYLFHQTLLLFWAN